MCGIAGLIHRGKSTNVGGQMHNMLQSLKHRGPDSTGYALYGSGSSDNYIMRFKVGENVKEGSSAVIEDESLYGERENQVKEKIVEASGKIISEDQCMDGISKMIKDIQVEATFPDGTKLVTVHYPIRKKESE